MYQTLQYGGFLDAFKRYKRVEGSADEAGANFSKRGLWTLWQMLEEYEADAGEELKLDVIGLCCTFGEYTEAEVMERLEDGLTIGDKPAALDYFIRGGDVREIEYVADLDNGLTPRRFIVGEAADWDGTRTRFAVDPTG